MALCMGFFFHPPSVQTRFQVIFHLFTHLKWFLGGIYTGSNEKKTIKDWWHISTIQAYRNSSYNTVSA
jgi:hypothetical protein